MIVKPLFESEILPLNHKRCGLCNQILPLSDYSLKRESSTGYNPYCRECSSKMNKEYRYRYISRKKGDKVDETIIHADTGNTYPQLWDPKDFADKVLSSGLPIPEIALRENMDPSTVRRYLRIAGYVYDLQKKQWKKR